MTKIKLCGLTRLCDIDYANRLSPDYIGFVFAPRSKRYVTPEQAALLRKRLHSGITPVGVFVDAELSQITDLLDRGIIEAIQLHGHEKEPFINELRKRTDCPIIQAFCIQSGTEIAAANGSSADYVLLDSGSGSGRAFDWSLLQEIRRPYFLAGGLTPENVGSAIAALHPFAVDASSSLEQNGCKDQYKMTAFVQAVRKDESL